MTDTKPRSIRIDDELWAAALAATRARGQDVSAVVREALRAYVRASATALAVVAMAVLLGACGGAEPAAAPSATVTSVSADDARDVLESEAAASASAATAELDEDARTLARVLNGECYSFYFGPQTGVLEDRFASLPTSDRPAGERIAAMQALLDDLPVKGELCTDLDGLLFVNLHDSLVAGIANAESESAG